MKRGRVRASLMLLVAALLLLHSCSAQLQSVNIGQAVENLATRFEEIANQGLGVKTLEERYSEARYTFSDLDDSSIDSMLSDDSVATSIDSVLDLFNSVVSNSSSSTPLTPVDCCDPQGSNDVCCFSCPNPSTQLINRISGAYSQQDLQDVDTLQFLTSDGALISRPHRPPFNSSTCEELDARLQPPYQSTIRSKPLEVVMMLDIDVTTGANSQASDLTVVTLKDTVRLILRSLGSQDRVAILGVSPAASIPPIISRLSPTSTRLQTVPVCDETISELEAFVTSYTLREQETANYTDSFGNAFGLLSNSTATDKLILFLTPGSVRNDQSPFPVIRDNAFPLIEQWSNATGNNVVISVIRMVSATLPGYNNLLVDLTSLSSIPGSIITLATQTGGTTFRLSGPIASSVALYNPFSVSQSATIRLQHEGGNLAISRPYYDNSNLVGVFHATLPWQRLLDHLTPSLTNRRSSYLFAVGSDRSVLYHPLLPDSRLVQLSVTDVEPEGVIGGLLDRVDSNPSSTQEAAVVKRLYVPSGSSDPNGFLLRSQPSRYFCRNIGVSRHTIYLCLLLADQDTTVGTLREIDDISAEYGSSNPPPIYHNVLAASELSDNVDVCNYFCKPSVNNLISFQLTGPDVPADSSNLISSLTSYIEEGSSPPAWVQPGVSTEVGVASVVSSQWRDTTLTVSDHITRRHLVTSSGAYLTFPPVHLNREFNPTMTEWYRSTLPRPGVITLTPPRYDPLREGGTLVVSAGYAIKAPSSQSSPSTRDSGNVLSVLAADLTFDSLRVFLRQALPQCASNDIICTIVDDLGNFIYGEELSNEPSYRGGAHFIGQPLGSNGLFEYRAIIRDVLRNTPDLLTKQQCVDHFNTSVKTRRFFQFNTSFDSAHISSESCINFMLQSIPDTNAFLIVRGRGDCRRSLICICNSDSRCVNCDVFRSETCECPCTCAEDCEKTTDLDILGCPQQTFEDPRFEQVASPEQTFEDNLCFNQGCNCRTSFDSCSGVRECSWCPTQRKCIHYTECCDGTGDCCADKQNTYGGCVTLVSTCFDQNNGQFNITCPVPDSPSNTALIVAVVIGCIFGLLLIALFVVFIVWYQCFRIADPKDETSRESAFDFSNKRTESTNPTAISGGGSEMNEKTPVTSPSNGGSEETQLDSKLDLGDTPANDEVKS